MRTLLKNAVVINVFTGEQQKTQVLLEDERILGVGEYGDEDADESVDLTGKYLCPGFLDGHIHIESSMLLPAEFARAALPHGTTAVMADPHEIANVCGKKGIEFMLEASEGLPMTVYLMVPSCVPATKFDEAGACLCAEDMEPFYQRERVLGLGEVMDYHGVARGEEGLLAKIRDALDHGLAVNGHAPLMTGRELDRYIGAGVGDDHECSTPEEAIERIRKGQRVMIRQGTAARNLEGLLPLFEEPYARRCMLVTDDRHPADLLQQGHIDDIIRQAVACGKNPVTAIQMATIQTAEYFGLRRVGAIAPGFAADLLVLDDLQTVAVRDVYKAGKKVVSKGCVLPFADPKISRACREAVCHSMHVRELSAQDFCFPYQGKQRCRVIGLVKDQLLTEELIREIDFDENQGVDLKKDLLKIAVIERHKDTGHIGLGLIEGTGLLRGALASSVSHDSHNLIVIGTSGEEMAFAANRVREMGGGLCVSCEGQSLAEMPLPYGGLMTDKEAVEAARQNEEVRQRVQRLGTSKGSELFMTMAFLSLPVIPHLKLTTRGLVDVDAQRLVSLKAEPEEKAL